MKKTLWVFIYYYRDSNYSVPRVYRTREEARYWRKEYLKDLNIDGNTSYIVSPIRKYELK
jgi:hypothetical protein